ncbi:MAG: hypothetical protein IT249_00555 [Chitinophagaceae bacterium]|nr:hypothetical protein [Chitinophagaceae bacterium]
MKDVNNKTCPSSLGQVGSNLLGMVTENGTVGFFKDPIEVTQGFIDDADDFENLERRFRFSNKCVQSGCKQWTGKECGVIKAVLSLDSIPLTKDLPSCSIRKNCRWYFQEGSIACNGCRYVITNVSEPTVKEPLGDAVLPQNHDVE